MHNLRKFLQAKGASSVKRSITISPFEVWISTLIEKVGNTQMDAWVHFIETLTTKTHLGCVAANLQKHKSVGGIKKRETHRIELKRSNCGTRLRVVGDGSYFDTRTKETV